MPELPDLLHVLTRLRERLVNLSVAAERVQESALLRFTVPGNLSLLLGRKLEDVMRSGRFLILRFEGLDLAVSPLAHGRFRFADPRAPDERSLCFALGFHATDEGKDLAHAVGLELRYLDEKKTSKAYLTASGDYRAVPGMDAVGVDILSPHFTVERLVSLLRHRHDPVRVFLVDHHALDSLGGAFADEALREAGIHPKTSSRALTHEQALSLHGAIVRVVRGAVEEMQRRNEPIESRSSDALGTCVRAVCPRCGAKIQTMALRAIHARFCPRCQPIGSRGL